MKKENTNKKAQATNTTKAKETKVMKNTKKETKAVETKKAVVKTETTNTEKVNTMLNIEEVMKLYSEAGIKCYNPTAKGNYRIMGNAKGSSLNIVPKKGEYRIYSTDTDYESIVNQKFEFKDLVTEKGTNSTDKSRPNTIVCKTVETLKALLGVYATNPANKVA